MAACHFLDEGRRSSVEESSTTHLLGTFRKAASCGPEPSTGAAALPRTAGSDSPSPTAQQAVKNISSLGGHAPKCGQLKLAGRSWNGTTSTTTTTITTTTAILSQKMPIVPPATAIGFHSHYGSSSTTKSDSSRFCGIGSIKSILDKGRPPERLHNSTTMTAMKPFDESSFAQTETPFSNRVVSSLIAMLQGVEVLCNLAIMFLYKDDFNINPAWMSILMSAIKVPWTVKPLWALLSDGVPLMGYRRKSYIIVGAAMCCFSTIGMGTFGYLNLVASTVLLFLYFLGSAICNVIGEALVVEAGRSEGTGGAAQTISTFFAFRKLSFAIMSYFSGFLLNYVRKEQIFVIATFLPLTVLVSAFCLVEAPCGSFEARDLRRQVAHLKEVVSEPILKNSTTFIFLLMATPSAGAAMFFFMTNDLKFGVELLGRMALLQSVASLGGILVYMTFFKESNIRRLLLFSTLIVTPFCLLPLVVVTRWNRLIGLPDSVFVLTDNVLMEFLGEFQVLPILVLAAQLCPPGLESTIYSFFLSSYNLGLAFGAVISAGITAMLGVTSESFANLPILITVCALSNYLPLLMLKLVPSQSEINARLKQAKTCYKRRVSDAFDDPEAAALNPESSTASLLWDGDDAIGLASTADENSVRSGERSGSEIDEMSNCDGSLSREGSPRSDMSGR